MPIEELHPDDTRINPVLEKVFLALRTNFIPDFAKEHITLRYYKNIRWQTLLMDAARLDKKLPATVIHDGEWHTWRSGGNSFRGLWLKAPDSPIFDHLNMPHITVPNRFAKYVDLHEIPSLEVIDSLWVGRSINGNYHWTKVSGKPVGAENVIGI